MAPNKAGRATVGAQDSGAQGASQAAAATEAAAGGGVRVIYEPRPCELLVAGSGESLFLWDLAVGRMVQEALPSAAAFTGGAAVTGTSGAAGEGEGNFLKV